MYVCESQSANICSAHLKCRPLIMPSCMQSISTITQLPRLIDTKNTDLRRTWMRLKRMRIAISSITFQMYTVFVCAHDEELYIFSTDTEHTHTHTHIILKAFKRIHLLSSLRSAHYMVWIRKIQPFNYFHWYKHIKLPINYLISDIPIFESCILPWIWTELENGRMRGSELGMEWNDEIK